jgi:hypothetical protein
MSFQPIRTAARKLDALPIAPTRLGDYALGRLHDKRRRVAATNPVWADIEQRRHRNGPGITLLSDDLTWADQAIQRRIETELTPTPWWYPHAARLRDWRLTRLAFHATSTLQRAQRGWSEIDAWNASHHLATIAGDMLAQLAEHAHSWPDNDTYPTFESWQEALREHAANLRLYGHEHDPEAAALLDTWGDLIDDPNSDPADVKAASEHLRLREVAIADNGRTSMHWLADNLDHLWD